LPPAETNGSTRLPAASPPPVRVSELDASAFPKSFGRVTAHLLPTVAETDGALTFGQVGAGLPFAAERFFLVRDVPQGVVRGGHAHHELEELLVCAHGECRITFDDGDARVSVVLDRPDVGLHVPSLVWSTQSDHSSGAVLLVLASRRYDEADYLDDYEEFRRVHRGG
jgi:hypothetical protein